MSRIKPGNPPLAQRFEVYVKGMELANGYHELTDAELQLQRFEADVRARKKMNYPALPIDMRLVDALKAGMPESAGIALGVDRLIMLKANAAHVDEVLAFPLSRA